MRFYAGPGADPLEMVLDTWGLTAHRRTAYGALSGGQQQRLFIALALLNRPEVVFLDELTQGLDPSARRVVWKLIEQLRRAGTTILLVTHFLDEAEVLCDRVAVMNAGRIVADGSPRELRARFGGRSRIRFTPATPVDAPRVRSLPGCVGVDEVDGRVTVTGNHETVAHTCALLVELGAVPADLEIEQPSLEDALLPLIGDEGTR